jgi:hypothetical protein
MIFTCEQWQPLGEVLSVRVAGSALLCVKTLYTLQIKQA